MGATSKQRLAEAEAKLRQAQETLDHYELGEYQLIFGIAYGAAAEAWETLAELRAQIAAQHEEIASLEAEVARLRVEAW